jgi:hypothetical protein
MIKEFKQWGEPTVVKKPKTHQCDKAMSSGGAQNHEWYWVLKGYLIQSKRFAHRLKFFHETAPEWGLEMLKDINLDTSIGFEDPEHVEEHRVQGIIEETEDQEKKVIG